MAINGTVTLPFADGDHDFNVAKIALVLELEAKCECGIQEIFDRLTQRRWRFYDVRETIRLGLIGGGKTPAAALSLTQRYVDARPFAENVQAAQLILMAALVGVPDDMVGKKKTEATMQADANASSDPLSTASVPPSDLHHDKLTNAPFGNSPRASMDGTARTEATKTPNHQQ